jgi:hypothetical protein
LSIFVNSGGSGPHFLDMKIPGNEIGKRDASGTVVRDGSRRVSTEDPPLPSPYDL